MPPLPPPPTILHLLPHHRPSPSTRCSISTPHHHSMPHYLLPTIPNLLPHRPSPQHGVPFPPHTIIHCPPLSPPHHPPSPPHHRPSPLNTVFHVHPIPSFNAPITSSPPSSISSPTIAHLPSTRCSISTPHHHSMPPLSPPHHPPSPPPPSPISLNTVFHVHLPHHHLMHPLPPSSPPSSQLLPTIAHLPQHGVPCPPHTII
ncbi:protein TRACHEARY ELEMENT DIFFERENTIATION-RELATED 7A-like [Haliotis rubra]|uniref:protein TRACHEARY ELEMENT DIFFERENTIATION-RELATED 7A-like n=1 Tax=Haliotis rubra TaxID=36100 RepID=UPI001EE52106|nr:protein TRACHEARY ELEMENT DIFFERENTIATION-RELATED 7A-like [Haliotis rubra]